MLICAANYEGAPGFGRFVDIRIRSNFGTIISSGTSTGPDAKKVLISTGAETPRGSVRFRAGSEQILPSTPSGLALGRYSVIEWILARFRRTALFRLCAINMFHRNCAQRFSLFGFTAPASADQDLDPPSNEISLAQKPGSDQPSLQYPSQRERTSLNGLGCSISHLQRIYRAYRPR